jgi:ATP-dependent DNA helicase HFM1/MER3
MKALCHEKYVDWQKRFCQIGVTCLEVTGDTEELKMPLEQANIILSTPEKWDSITRKNYLTVNLLLVDEVHTIEQPTRGATLEAVVSRMKMIDMELRIVAISATIPNVEDIAEWLGAPPHCILKFDSSYRPITLQVKVLGY